MNGSTARRRRTTKAKRLVLPERAGAALKFIDAGRFDDAQKICSEQLEANPERHTFSFVLARLAMERGHMRHAIAVLSNIAERNARVPEYQFWLGEALCRAGQFSKAGPCFEHAVALSPAYAEAHNSLGYVRSAAKQTDAAIASFRAALRHQPSLAAAHNNLGALLFSKGRREEAVACYQRALQCEGDFTEPYWHLSAIRPQGLTDEELTKLEGGLPKIEQSPRQAVHAHYALARSYDRRDRPQQAMQHLSAAKSIQRETVVFDLGKHEALVDELIDTFDTEFFAAHAGIGNHSTTPVFIVGMPRSGTTLVEQILSSHSLLEAGGEVEELGRIERSLQHESKDQLPYPRCVGQFDASRIETLAASYLEALSLLAPGAPGVTDKAIGSFLRLGLAHTLFPEARIVHVRRHPLDTCLSIYFENFTHLHAYAYDLETLGAYYHSYSRLMRHWHEQFGQRIFELEYDQLVNAPRETCMRLLDFLGLDWEERCLEFYENDRIINTASSMQVREPLYTRSIGRWRRYEEFLGKLADILADELTASPNETTDPLERK